MKYSAALFVLATLSSAMPTLDKRALPMVRCRVFSDTTSQYVNVDPYYAPVGYTAAYNKGSLSANYFNVAGTRYVTYNGLAQARLFPAQCKPVDVASILPNLVSSCQQYSMRAGNDVAVKQQFVQQMVARLRAKYGRNVIVCRSASGYHFTGKTVLHTVVSLKLKSSSIPYDVIVWKRGNFQLKGTGGMQNFGYGVSASCTRQGAYVSCPGPTSSSGTSSGSSSKPSGTVSSFNFGSSSGSSQGSSSGSSSSVASDNSAGTSGSSSSTSDGSSNTSSSGSSAPATDNSSSGSTDGSSTSSGTDLGITSSSIDLGSTNDGASFDNSDSTNNSFQGTSNSDQTQTSDSDPSIDPGTPDAI